MTRLGWLRTLCIIPFAALLSQPVASQNINPKDAVQEIAALNSDILSIGEIIRISDDIVFWQSVAIMGSEYGWTFDFTGQGNIHEWKYRLYNA